MSVQADNLHDVIECLHAYSQGEIHTGVVAANKVEILETKSNNNKENKHNKKKKQSAKLALVFSGNGSQWQGMGCELLETEPLFLETVKQINSLLNQYEEISLIDEFKALEDDSRLEETKIAQPLLFALQVGMLHVLVSKGLQVDAVIGHSVGEVAAAYASGIFKFRKCCKSYLSAQSCTE